MKHPLDDSRAKLLRGKEHIAALNSEVAFWIQERASKGDTVTTRYEYNLDSQKCEAFIDAIPEAPPFRFGVIVGDAIHNLRGALDHLAWELADLNDPERGEDNVTQFPIAMSDKHFLKPHIQRMMRFIHADDAALIEKEQPYHASPEHSEDHALSWLQDLSNRDKHQGIHPASVSVASYYQYPVPNTDCTIENLVVYGVDLEVGAKIMEMSIVPTGPNPAVQVQAVHPPTVSIQSGNQLGEVQILLPNLCKWVEGIIGRFSALFPS